MCDNNKWKVIAYFVIINLLYFTFPDVIRFIWHSRKILWQRDIQYWKRCKSLHFSLWGAVTTKWNFWMACRQRVSNDALRWVHLDIRPFLSNKKVNRRNKAYWLTNGGIFIVNYLSLSLQWRHNERDGVSNHQRLGCLLNRLFRHKLKVKSKFHINIHSFSD